MLKFIKKAKIGFKLVAVLVSIAIFSSALFYYDSRRKATAYSNIVNLPIQGNLPLIKPRLNGEAYHFPVIRGMEFDVRDPLNLKFYFDAMDQSNVSRKDINRLVKYFLGFLTIPEDKLWVNLSPYEKDRMIPDSLAQLDIGKDLLLEDYILKQITASLTDPKTAHGRKFWKKIRKITYKIAKTTKIPVNTFHKIWIVPETAVVCEHTTAVSKIPPFFALQKMARSRHFAKQNDGQKSKIKMTNQKYKNDPKFKKKEGDRLGVLGSGENKRNTKNKKSLQPKTHNPKPNVKFFIKEARLKVMLEEDYILKSKIKGQKSKTPFDFLRLCSGQVAQGRQIKNKKSLQPKNKEGDRLGVLGSGENKRNTKNKKSLQPKTYNPKPNSKSAILRGKMSRSRPDVTSGRTIQKINSEYKEIFRRDLLPIIEKEINESRTFAPLRQIYYALILALHFKSKLKDNAEYLPYINQEKTQSIPIKDPAKVKEVVYQSYINSFKKGIYNQIKREYDPYLRKKITRRYFSGGTNFTEAREVTEVEQSSNKEYPQSMGAAFQKKIAVEGKLVKHERKREEEKVISQDIAKKIVSLNDMLHDEGGDGDAFTEKELQDFIKSIKEIAKLVEDMELIKKDIRKKKKDCHEKIVRKLILLRRKGKFLFDQKEGLKIAKKKDVVGRLIWFLKLAMIQDNNKKFLFKSSHSIKIVRTRALDREKEIKDEIKYLCELKGEKGKALFNGYQISQIVLSGEAIAEKKKLIKYLCKLKGEEGKALFNGYQISQIVLSGEAIAEKKKLIKYLCKLKGEEGKALFNGYQISQIVLSGEAIAEKKGLIKYLRKLKGEKGKALFNGSQISQIVLSGEAIAEKKGLIKYLRELKGEKGKALFNGSQISQIVYSGEAIAEKKGLIKYLRELKGEKGKALFNGYQISQIVYSGEAIAEKKGLIKYLRELKGEEGKALFNGYQISQIVLSGEAIAEKKGLIKYLRELKGEEGKALFNGYQISQIVLSGEAIAEKKKLIKYLCKLKGEEGKALFNGYPISQIVLSGEAIAEKKGLIKYLRELKGEKGKALFNGSQISQIVYSGEAIAEKKGLIKYLRELKGEKGKALFNGYQISQIVYSGEAIAEKKGLIKYLRELKGEEGKALFNGYQISQIVLSGEAIAEKKGLIKYLRELKGEEGKALFNGYQISQIVLSGEAIAEKKKLIKYLRELKGEEGKALFNGYQISQIIRRYRYFDETRYCGVKEILRTAKVYNSDSIIWWVFYPDECKEMLKKWRDRAFKYLDLTSQRRRSGLLSSFESEFKEEDIIKLAKIYFAEEEYKTFCEYVEREASEDRKAYKRLKEVKLAIEERDKVIKRLMLSFSKEIRKDVISYIYEVLARDIIKAQERYGDKAADVFYEYLSRYDWIRPKAGIENLRRNYKIALQHKDSYLKWISLPREIKKALNAIKRLERGGLKEREIEDYLVNEKGFRAEEIIKAKKHSKEISLDAIVGEGNTTLYNFVANTTTESIEIEDLEEVSMEERAIKYVQGDITLDSLREEGKLTAKEYELAKLEMEGYRDEGISERLEESLERIEEIKQSLGEKLVRYGIVTKKEGFTYIAKGDALIEEFKQDVVNNDGYAKDEEFEREVRELLAKGMEASPRIKRAFKDDWRQWEIYAFKRYIRGEDEFVLGYGDKERKRIYLSEEVIASLKACPPEVLAEYLWHEMYHTDEHYATIARQQKIFAMNYTAPDYIENKEKGYFEDPNNENKIAKGELGEVLRQIVNDDGEVSRGISKQILMLIDPTYPCQGGGKRLVEISKGLAVSKNEKSAELLKEIIKYFQEIIDDKDGNLFGRQMATSDLKEIDKDLAANKNAENIKAAAEDLISGTYVKTKESAIFSEDMKKSLLWLKAKLPYEEKIVDEYFQSNNPESFIADLTQRAERVIREGFDYNKEEEVFLAWIGVRKEGIKISLGELKERMPYLIKFDKKYPGSFKRLFSKAQEKGLKVIEVSAEGSRQIDMGEVDLEVFDQHLEKINGIKKRVDDLSYFKGLELSKKTRRRVSAEGIYYELKKAEAESSGLIKEGERFMVEFPEEQEIRRYLQDKRKKVYQHLFKLAYEKMPGKNRIEIMGDLILSEILENSNLLNRMRSKDQEEKVSAFKNFYQNYVNHLPDAIGIKLSKIRGLKEVLDKMSERIYEQIEKMIVTESKEKGSYRLVPQGFMSVFRGEAGISDCSFDVDRVGNAFTRAMAEDTQYYFVYKGKELKGYIGLLEGRTEEGKKVLTIDTVQSPSLDGEELLMNLFIELEQAAKEIGCEAIALPKNMAEPFNFDNKKTIKEMEVYKKARVISVSPAHKEDWQRFREMFGLDTSNSIEKGKFKLLDLTKAKKERKDRANNAIGKDKLGGIDLNRNLFKIKVEGDAKGVKYQVDPNAMPNNTANFIGFTFTIKKIKKFELKNRRGGF